ncbi:mannitol dehydrogenase family protein [Burkholderia aenigmatica]|uniref:Mannitol dehydrogenase n=1 Tax=Burkholderia aenigmatica TaxID=2015348 RepID=A0A228IP13_9BURK|nr:mannitol dehydrogenase family protein [Burkholderia aenigmatica]OXI43832.1 mannitol dehydrogenase [Burkholderia aenigmatica]
MKQSNRVRLSEGLVLDADLPLVTPSYDRRLVTAGIAHIGVGNFHRAHEAFYVDRCLAMPGQESWGICGIGLGSSRSAMEKAVALQDQDCLYTLAELASDGRTCNRIIGALVEYMHAPADPESVLKKLADPAIKIVSLTITEGGYNFDESSGEFMLESPDVARDLAGGVPRTAFGFIVESLRRRRAANLPAFTVVSCDNLRQNGNTARRAILAFAKSVDAVLADWIAENVAFPNSMVDRIVPTVTAEVREHVNAMTGIDDQVPVVAETFTQWVIEDKFSNGRPKFEAVGVELRDDVEAYEAIKGRMLNASHMLISFSSLLLGYRLVHEAMGDSEIVELLTTFLTCDVEPLISAPAGVSLSSYRSQIVARFSNSAVGDQLLRVAHDGASKVPVFHTKTLRDLVREGADVRRETLLLASFRELPLKFRLPAGRV